MANRKRWSRREILKQSGMISAAGAAAAMAPHTVEAAVTAAAKAAPAKAGALKAGQVLAGKQLPHTDGDFHDNLFTRIGIRPLINCRGTITAISGSTSLPEVKQAMYNASLYHVRMDEMMDAVGAELGKLCGAEWGIAVTGSAAATCLATIASVAGTNIEQCEALPYIKKKDQVVIPKFSRNPYDIGCRMSGMGMVEFSTAQELRDRITDRTAMMYILPSPRYSVGEMTTKNLAAIAHERGVPVFVDSAATEPNKPNIHIADGADLVAYSGGKCMRGPQSSGLLIGNKSLCQAAFYQSAPHHCYGRPMKISKEETMGLLAAVRAWHVTRDHDAEQKMWLGWSQQIADRMKGLPSVKATVLPPPPVEQIDRSPGVRITWDPTVVGIYGSEVVKLLDEAPTRIVLGGTGTRPVPGETPMGGRGGGGRGGAANGGAPQSSLTIYVYIMTPEEIKITANAIYDILKKPPKMPEPAALPAGTPAQVAGTWAVTVHYLRGTGNQHFTLHQNGNVLTGDHAGELYDAIFRGGSIHGNEIALTSVLPVTGYPVTCNFKGTVNGSQMSGTLNMGEYGEVTWDAVKV